jgi:pSer/pThr/pTyr-binding forkhead associated (FHA) protein
MIYAASSTDGSADGDAPSPTEHVALSFAGKRHEIVEPPVVLGRSKDCDIQVPDPNVSRRHAEVRLEGDTYTLVDLDSTNGIEVGARKLKQLDLEDGTRFTLGSTEIVFSREFR